ncbi:hypothetical protein [Mucilaginibacter aquaedulcis]|uniref:hypothetical protein n=1 Tax=Mucilaginibacter aquaedulcis TaxID=1187081 RepID=UPI0025B404E0|nr:hypothetical protein [Mucilaginibacter aquaedulcis]MDN3550024.1 hypothetical protein [Mucilaginibacter aquaedulcis]
MAAQDSDLSAYGFDVVVASTEQALNYVIKQYVNEFKKPKTGSGGSPVFNAYFMIEPNTKEVVPLPAAWDQSLYDHYVNLDPLSIAAWNGIGTMPQSIKNLSMPYMVNYPPFPSNTYLRYAISFELGFTPDPSKPGSVKMPAQILQLVDDGQYAIYTLCFQNLTLTVANYNSNYSAITSYEVYKQNAANPYWFTVKVPLKSISDSTNVSDDVATRAAALGNAFTIEQLVLDLDNAQWNGAPVIQDAPSGSAVNDLLNTVFLPFFAQTMATNGRAALGFNFIPKENTSADFGVTDIQLQIDDASGDSEENQPGLPTLDYLCAVNGDARQATADFSDSDNYYLDGLPYWNWFDGPTSYHGVIAVSPGALASYFSKALLSYVQTNCYLPTTGWTWSDDKEMWLVNTPSVQAGQVPVISLNQDGYLVKFSYTPPSGTGYSKNQQGDSQQLTPSFTLTIAQGGNNTIVVTQELIIWYSLTEGSNVHGNVVDTILTDSYTLATDTNGNFAPAVTSVSQDKSQKVSFGSFINFFEGDPNSMISTIKSWAQTLAAKNVTDIPISIMQGLVFPGGNAFSMNELQFSSGGDLIAYINYATPAYITA